MSGKNIKLTESMNVVQVYDLTVTTASTSSVAQATLTFDQVFSSTPDVMSCYVNDGTKGELNNKCIPISVTPASLVVYIHGDVTHLDSSQSCRIIVHGKL